MKLGIDFGTCFMSAAYMQGSVPMPVRFGYILSQPAATYVTPQGEVLVGVDAADRRMENPAAFRQHFKRDLGQPAYVFESGQRIEIESLVTRMFVQARAAATAQAPALGAPDSVVASVPVTYEAVKRDLMRSAAHTAGFTTVDLIDEPAAAAEHWSAQFATQDKGRERLVLVYDLGGGTFDATLARVSDGRFALMGLPVGQADLGGNSIDAALLKLIERERPQAFGGEDRTSQRRRRMDIAEKCRQAKEKLTTTDQAMIFLETTTARSLEPFLMDRAGLSDLIAPLVAETLELCTGMLAAAGMKWEDLTDILLVGGSCRMPLLQNAVAARSGRQPQLADDPALAVCFGAARYAERLARERAAPVVPTVKLYNPHRPLFDLWDKGK